LMDMSVSLFPIFARAPRARACRLVEG